MDVRQLRYFSTIAEERQITRAAKKLHMAQPPLSQQLKALEQELGVILLDRNGKTMELTEAGKVLYDRAKELLQRLDETRIEVKELGEGIKGVLSIGSVKSCFSYIPERIRSFRKQYPMVNFRLYEGDSYRLADHLRKRDIELAIVRLPLDPTTDFSSMPLPIDSFVAVTTDTQDERNSIPLKELADMPLMLLHRVSGVGLYELVVNKCKNQGFEPNIVCECPDAAMLLSLVKAGVGVTLLPKSTLNSFPINGLKTLEIEDCTIESESAVIWLKDRFLSKSALRFIETFQ
ncbi:LysR family transcriptional regulator [Peribacillus butanolivorans]|uniref:LysR family transcriptional regulator n=1 Tax=Peribacillus butanolivorans TaxID=421767 RepID=UPI0006A713BD|nr:LysR family transcriptional regulator [Peribacillus butanolivorans]KON69465.1 LysR family transcriptional regulator [Peribacillus butanolivorans]